ncbi:MAG: thioredoxin-dependent thiol peroxidase [Bacteroidetes bacterium]|nr:MAG: thioredoxin-dependent thiol peroxidase [Bacteroidota bacterium]
MTHLKKGDKAPHFEGIDQDGQPISLDDFKGKKLILYFYPKDNTPGCTTEACNLRDHYAELKARGYEVVGVSPDSPRRHQNFISKYALPFRLIADEDHSIAQAYGVWGKKKMYGRAYEGICRNTAVIGEDGTIEAVFPKVDVKRHAEQILEALEAQA